MPYSAVLSQFRMKFRSEAALDLAALQPTFYLDILERSAGRAKGMGRLQCAGKHIWVLIFLVLFWNQAKKEQIRERGDHVQVPESLGYEAFWRLGSSYEAKL